MMKKPYRILSLDGGGSWALVQVVALQALYPGLVRGHDVLKDFDLVVANSGGSITLGGLVADKRLDELLDMFLKKGNREQIFRRWASARGMLNRFLHRLVKVGAKYDSRAKLRGLGGLLGADGKAPMSDLPKLVGTNWAGKPTHFLICALDYDQKRAKFFRSHFDSCSSSSKNAETATLAEAIHASTNAPVNYFDAPAEVGDRRFWDGAIAGYNNPALVGVTEALANGISASDIQVLSIGTASVSVPGWRPDRKNDLSSPREAWRTLFGDVQRLAMSVLDDPPDVATYVAHIVLGNRPEETSPSPTSGSVIRLCPVVRPERNDRCEWVVPEQLGEDSYLALVNIDLDAIEDREVKQIARLADLWVKDAVPNQAIRETKEFACQIGHDKFSAAAEAWRRLTAKVEQRASA